MKSLLNDIFGSQSTEGKLAVNTALEALIDVEVTQPAKDELFSESVELVEKVVATHDDDNVREAAGQLLKALVMTQGVDETSISTVSQEGLGSFITRIKNAVQGRDKHGVKGSDKKPGQKTDDEKVAKRYSKEGEEAFAELSKNLDKFYLNDNWLKDQEFVEGDVNCSDFGDLFVVGGKAMGPFEGLEAMKKHVDEVIIKYDPALKEFEKQLMEINDRLYKLAENPSVEDDELVDRAKAAIKQMGNLPSPLEKFPNISGTGMGNSKLVVRDGRLVVTPSSDPKGKGLKELPALDKDGVKKAAKLIKSLLSWKKGEHYFNKMPDYDWLDHSDGSKFNDRLFDADDEVFLDYYDKFDYQDGPDRFTYPVYKLYNEHRLASALERWIDRSIK